MHRGMEKLAETRMDYDQVNFLADRVCGICGFTHRDVYKRQTVGSGSQSTTDNTFNERCISRSHGDVRLLQFYCRILAGFGRLG